MKPRLPLLWIPALTAIPLVCCFLNLSFGSETQVKQVLQVDHQALLFHVQGHVQIKRYGETKWQQAENSTLVSQGDEIQTQDSGSADLALDPYYLNLVHVGENSHTIFQSIEPTTVAVNQGSIFSSIQGMQPGETYEVSTPAMIAGVRGTEFWTDYDASRSEGAFAVLPENPNHPAILDLWPLKNGQRDQHWELREGLEYHYGSPNSEASAKPFQPLSKNRVKMKEKIFSRYPKQVKHFEDIRLNGLLALRAIREAQTPNQGILIPGTQDLAAQEAKKKKNVKSQIMKGIAQGLAEESGIPGLGSLTDKMTESSDSDAENH